MFKLVLVVLNSLIILALSSSVFAQPTDAGNTQEMVEQSTTVAPKNAMHKHHKKCSCDMQCRSHKHHKKMKKQAPKVKSNEVAKTDAVKTDAVDAPKTDSTDTPKTDDNN